MNRSIYADIKNNKFTKPSIEIKKHLIKAHLELVEAMFITYSKTGFHIQGGIKKSLENGRTQLKENYLKKQG